MSLLSNAYKLEHSWRSVKSEPLSEEERANIALIKVDEGAYGLQMTFFMKDKSTLRMPVSKYSSLQKGDTVRANSVIIEELHDEVDNKTVYRASGKAL